MSCAKLFSFLFGIVSFFSCADNLIPDSKSLTVQNPKYSVPLEAALSSLENFMIENGWPVTKGGIHDYVDNYFVVSAPSTKVSDCGNDIIYAVNFKEGGYALLAADRRITEDILAVTDNGYVLENDFDKPKMQFTPTVNDDLSVNDFTEMIRAGVLASTEKMINHECMMYASRQLEAFNYRDEETPCDPSIPGGGGGYDGSSTEVFEWKTVGGMILAKKWLQGLRMV